MTEAQFIPYHNRHIKFILKNGTQLSGVLWDSSNMANRTLYKYIATNNMVAWKQAEQNKDNTTMKSLEGQIDLQDIVSAELLNY